MFLTRIFSLPVALNLLTIALCNTNSKQWIEFKLDQLHIFFSQKKNNYYVEHEILHGFASMNCLNFNQLVFYLKKKFSYRPFLQNYEF